MMLRKLLLIGCIPLAIAGCGGGDGTAGLDLQANSTKTMTGTTVSPPTDSSSTPVKPGIPPQDSGNPPAQQAGSAARFTRPQGITLDRSGKLYVTDSGTVRKISPDGSVTTLAGVSGQFGDPFSGPADGTGTAARFNILTAITTDFLGKIYVTDTFLNTGRIRKITPDGTVTTLFEGIYGLGITTDENRNLYIANNFHGSIDILSPEGTISRLLEGTLEPRGIARDPVGNLYVLNTGLDFPPLGQTTFSCRIDKVTPSGMVTTLAGSRATSEFENTCGHADGQGAQAKIGTNAQGITIGRDGNLYFADTNNHTIRKVTPDGVVTTIAGLAGSSGSSDGTGSEARFNGPRGITIDTAGNLYVADTENHTIRKVTPAGVVTTFAGSAGEPGSVDAP